MFVDDDIKLIFIEEFEKNSRSSLELDEYLSAAEDYFRDSHTEAQNWRSPLWNFTRGAKGHPELEQLSSRQALQRVANWLRATGREWTDFGLDSSEEAKVEFMHIWEAIRFAPGKTPLESAILRAKQTPLGTNGARTEGYDTFLSIAGWLQVIMRDQNILLPCELLALHLNVTAMTVSRYRRFAIKDGFLRKIKPHNYKPGSGGEATEFRFVVEHWEVLKNAMGAS